MTQFHSTVGNRSRTASTSLKALLAKASPLRSGDVLAGIAAENDEERVAAQWRSPMCRSPASSMSRSFRTRTTK